MRVGARRCALSHRRRSVSIVERHQPRLERLERGGALARVRGERGAGDHLCVCLHGRSCVTHRAAELGVLTAGLGRLCPHAAYERLLLPTLPLQLRERALERGLELEHARLGVGAPLLHRAHLAAQPHKLHVRRGRLAPMRLERLQRTRRVLGVRLEALKLAGHRGDGGGLRGGGVRRLLLRLLRRGQPVRQPRHLVQCDPERLALLLKALLELVVSVLLVAIQRLEVVVHGLELMRERLDVSAARLFVLAKLDLQRRLGSPANVQRWRAVCGRGGLAGARGFGRPG